MTNPWEECDDRWGCPKSAQSGWIGYLGSNPSTEVPEDTSHSSADSFLTFDLFVQAHPTGCDHCTSSDYQPEPQLCAALPGGQICQSSLEYSLYGGAERETVIEGTTVKVLTGFSPTDTDTLKYTLQAYLPPCLPTKWNLEVSAELRNPTTKVIRIKSAQVQILEGFVDYTVFATENYVIDYDLAPSKSPTLLDFPLILDQTFDTAKQYKVLVSFFSPSGDPLQETPREQSFSTGICNSDKAVCLFVGGAPTSIATIYSGMATSFQVIATKAGNPNVSYGERGLICPSSGDSPLASPLNLHLVSLDSLAWATYDSSTKILNLFITPGKSLPYEKEFLLFGTSFSMEPISNSLGSLIIPSGENEGQFEFTTGLPPILTIVPKVVNIE